jgi:amidase/aspartyl-tRNA(Asn)/glutamyl-tRNA(Gln) amidotransferase subunit A
MTDLFYLPASEALRMFRGHELSPVELMESVIARTDAVDPTVNALCHRFFDRALEQARAAEARYMGRGEPPRALEGTPTAIKEEEAVAGEPWTQGSLICKDLVATESSCFAQRSWIRAPSCARARQRLNSRAPRLRIPGFGA